VSIVVSDAVESIKEEDEALKFLGVIKGLDTTHRVMNVDEEVNEAEGIGIIFANDFGCLNSFYGIKDVRIEEVTAAMFLNLVETAREKKLARIVWSVSAFAKLDELIDDLRKAYDLVANKYGIWPKGTVRLLPTRRLTPTLVAWEKEGDPRVVEAGPDKVPVPFVLYDDTLRIWEERLIAHGMCQ
jgi:hypothetical protein